MLRLGIVGLPNVGKSTLFNALTSSKAAAAENYPFCTVEPNVGVVEVPDARLERLNEVVRPKKKIPAVVEFVDIAGLVKGASQGEGLGNQFLSHIREVDAVVHVIRCFDDPDVVHVMGPVDPVRDHDVITSELALADLAVVGRRLGKTRKTARAGDKEAQAELVVLERVMAELDAGRGAREAGESEAAVRFLRQLGLLTAKPILYAANVNEDELAGGGGRWLDKLRAAVQVHHEEAEIVPFSAKLEAELGELAGEERREYLASAGVTEPGLDRLIHAGYRLLGLQTFFTVGENEVRAWTMHRGDTAFAAAGEIHSDFQRGFIRAETVSFGDFVRAAAIEIRQRVEPPEPPLLALVKPGQGAFGEQAPRLDDDRTQLHGVHVEQHRERQCLPAFQRDVAVVCQAVAVQDADRLPPGRKPGDRERPGAVAHAERPGSPHRDHHAGDGEAVGGRSRSAHDPGGRIALDLPRQTGNANAQDEQAAQCHALHTTEFTAWNALAPRARRVRGA